MPINIYTTKTIRKIRELADIKRNFLRELYFKGSSKVNTEEIVLEIQKGGEYIAPLVTPIENGKVIPRNSRYTNIIMAPTVAAKYTLTPKDMFSRPEGAVIGGENPNISAGKLIGKILENQENYIKNREELMVAQFLTTGKVESVNGDNGYEVDYGLENIETLPSADMWDKTGVDPLISLDKLISNAEKNGVKIKNIVMGRKAAQLFIEKLHENKKLSKDLQSEVSKNMVREYPGVTWLGTYNTYGVEIYRYDRVVKTITNDNIDLIPENVVIGGPEAGEVLYAPIVIMSEKGPELHLTERFSTTNVSANKKISEIVTEARPVLQPVELTGYFCATVC